MRAQTSESAPARATFLALGGLVLTAAAPVIYVSALDVPLLRASGLVGWIALAAGLALGFAAVRRDRRRWVSAALLTEGIVASCAIVGFIWLARLPEERGASTLARAPSFVLPDHTQARVALDDALARGPVLLVFFRGTW